MRNQAVADLYQEYEEGRTALFTLVRRLAEVDRSPVLIRWAAYDVDELFYSKFGRHLTDEAAYNWLLSNKTTIQDRSISIGWDVIDDLMELEFVSDDLDESLLEPESTDE